MMPDRSNSQDGFDCNNPHQNVNEEDTPHFFSFPGTWYTSARGHHVPGSRQLGYQSSASHYHRTTESAVTAAAATASSDLQTMREGMATVFVEEPGLGGSGVAGDEINDANYWELGLFVERRTPTPTKRTSTSLPPPDFDTITCPVSFARPTSIVAHPHRIQRHADP